MNSLLEEIYSTIIPSAPYLIAAYALIIVVLFAFLALTLKHVKHAEAQLELLEEAQRRETNAGEVL